MLPGTDDIEFRHLLRLALRATSQTAALDGDLHTNEESERRSPLTALVLFSRRFIIWYNVVLVFALALFTASHLLVHVRRLPRHQQPAIQATITTESSSVGDNTPSNTPSSTSSSSSSTLSAVSQPVNLPKDESTPLLPAKASGNALHHRNTLSNVKALLMHQPAAIPFVNKTLPSNLTTVGIILLLALNLFFLFYRDIPTVSTAFVFADRAGLLFVANLPLLYVLSAKNSPLRSLTGFSYENVNIVHRRLGEMLCMLAVLHTAGMLVVWYTILRPVGIDFLRLLSMKLIWLGVVTFFCYETLYFTSLSSFRQAFYEIFLASHVLLQLGALIFLWLHHHGSRPYVGIATGIFLLDRLLFRLFAKRRTVNADLTILEDGQTIMLSANWAVSSHKPAWRRLIKHDILYGWRPTEHVFLSIPSLAAQHLVQTHPFTIASAAPSTTLSIDTSSGTSEHAWFNLLIRARTGFSADLLRYAQSHSNVPIQIDGPYGSLHALEMMHSSDTCIIVAGGSGIAVAIPLIWSLLDDKPPRQELQREITLIWVVHDSSHIDWIGHERLDELRQKGLKIVIPAPTNKAGRPDIGTLVRNAIENSTECTTQRRRTGAVVSGPDGMNRTVRNTCAEMLARGMDVRVSVEKFGW